MSENKLDKKLVDALTKAGVGEDILPRFAEAGLLTVEAVYRAKNETLKDIKGVGIATVDKIRLQIAGTVKEPEAPAASLAQKAKKIKDLHPGVPRAKKNLVIPYAGHYHDFPIGSPMVGLPAEIVQEYVDKGQAE
jgi:hypothetical protein